MRRYGLRDDQWIGFKDFLPAAKAMWAARRPTTDCLVEAVLDRFSGRHSVAGIFQSVAATGRSSTSASAVGEERRFVTRFVFTLLASDHDNELMMIDPPPSCRAHQHSESARKKQKKKTAKQAIGRSRADRPPKSVRSSMPSATPSR